MLGLEAMNLQLSAKTTLIKDSPLPVGILEGAEEIWKSIHSYYTKRGPWQ